MIYVATTLVNEVTVLIPMHKQTHRNVLGRFADDGKMRLVGRKCCARRLALLSDGGLMRCHFNVWK